MSDALPLALLDDASGDDLQVREAVREHLSQMHERLARLHNEQASGRVLNETHAAWMDALVLELVERADPARGSGTPLPLAVAAVGGYGRSALCVHSDVDLLLLYGEPRDDRVANIAELLQRWLWDAGLTLGCATRSIAETLSLAREDVTVCNAVLDARLITGDPALVAELDTRLLNELRRDAAAFVAACAAAREARNAEYGESLYLLQPNVKEGAGGLRDYHSAWWAARVAHAEVRRLADLEGPHRLTAGEMVDYAAALDFLWHLRNELHLSTGRAADQMTFDLQERVALHFGYAQSDGPELPVERFMRDYYRHARVIQNFSSLLLELAAQRVRPASERRVEVVEEGFRIADGHLEIADAEQLRSKPERLLAAFAVAQTHDVPLSRRARRLIRENLDSVDERLRCSPEAAAWFDRVLTAENRVWRTLTAMNETGLLAAYVPEWEHVVCLWQHVTYHTYTVDVHSIFLVEELRRLWHGEHERDLPDLTELMRGVKDRGVLFLGSLLHDVGKGLGGDHSLRGTDLARAMLERMGMGAERRDRILFLVEHHLLMSHLAQRRDLSDPKLIHEFARTVGNRPNLRNLYLLTFADIRASSRRAWNEWKGQLLRELFERTADYLEAGGDDPQIAAEQIEARVEARQDVARRQLQNLGVGEGRIDACFDEMPRRYFMAHSGAQITRHAMAMLSFEPSQVVATQVRAMRGDFSELIVVTPDVHGLYAIVCGVITAKWINILGSYVYTTRSGLALEVYRLATPPGGGPELREVWRGLQNTLHEVLSGAQDVRSLLERRGLPLGASAAPSPAPVQVEITNEESDFYTIVDVTANDRLGLLYDLTQTIAEHGFEIYVSKASTILDQVADTFYLKDAERRKIHDDDALERLRVALLMAATGGSAGR